MEVLCKTMGIVLFKSLELANSRLSSIKIMKYEILNKAQHALYDNKLLITRTFSK
jgi:hypothetical protein